MESVLLDVAGQPRSPATMPGYHRVSRVGACQPDPTPDPSLASSGAAAGS
jgi:hypothetical protein